MEESASTADALKGALAGAASVGGLAALAKSAMDFEDAMAGVAKVTGASKEQIAELGEKVKGMAVQFGMSAEEVAAMAEAGGQLGVALPDLMSFAELAGKMSVAFGMTADEAGQAAAVLSNVFKKPILEIEALGNAINALGNSGSASEKQIIDFLTRVGGAAKDMGLSAEQTAALGSTMMSLGKTAEVAGTAMTSFISKLNTGGGGAKEFTNGLKEMGWSAEELARKIKENPQQAVNDFLATLSKMDASKRGELLIKMFGSEFADDVGALAGAMDVYSRNLATVADTTANAGAMTGEFETKMGTTSAAIGRAQASLGNLAKTLGSHFLPLISGVANAAGGMIQALDGMAKEYPMLTNLALTLTTVKVSALGLSSALTLAGLNVGKLGVALRAINALPLVAALTAAVFAFQQLDTEAKKAYSSAQEAADEALESFEGLKKSMAEGVQISTADLEKGLKSINDAVKQNEAALEKLRAEAAEVGQDWFGAEAMMDYLGRSLPFLDSYSEKAEKLRAKQEELKTAMAEQTQIVNMQKAQEALAALTESQSKALDSSRNITAETKTILDNLKTVAETGVALSNEQVQSVANNIDRISNLEKLQEARALIATMHKQGQIDAAAYATQLERIDQSYSKLRENRLSKSDLPVAEMETLNAAAKELGYTLPEVYQKMTPDEANIIRALQAIDTQIKRAGVTAQDAGELLKQAKLAMDKMETEKGRKELEKYFQTAMQTANASQEQIAEMAEITGRAVGKSAKEAEAALKRLSLSADGISASASQLQEDWPRAMEALSRSGKLTADTIYDAFNAALKNLKTTDDFRAFNETLEKTGTKSELTAAQLQILNAGMEDGARAVKNYKEALSESDKVLDDLGITLSGLSPAAERLQIKWQDAMHILRAEGQLTAENVRKAFDASFKNLGSADDFSAYLDVLKETGTYAQLSAQQQEILAAGLRGGADAAQQAADAQKKQAEAASKVKDSTTAMTAADRSAVAAKTELSGATEKTATALAKADEATKAASTQVYKTQLYDATKLTEQQKNAIHGQYVQALKLQAQLNGSYGVMESASARATDNMIKSAQELTRYNQTVASLNEKINLGTWHVRDLTTSYSSLGDQLDGRVSAAMDKIREKMRAANDEAADTVKNLRAQLAELNGDSTAQMRLDNERKLQELRAKRDTAKARGNNDETRSYEEALQLQERINSKRLAQQLEQQRQRAASSSNLDYEKAARQIGDSIEDNTRRMVAEGERRALTNLTEKLIQDQKRRPQ